MCELVSIMVSDSEEFGPEYSDWEFFCETCGEYVNEPCEDDDEAG